jgi:hypothetical protein
LQDFGGLLVEFNVNLTIEHYAHLNILDRKGNPWSLALDLEHYLLALLIGFVILLG